MCAPDVVRRMITVRLSLPMIAAVALGTSTPARTYAPVLSVPWPRTRSELAPGPVKSLVIVPSCVPVEAAM